MSALIGGDRPLRVCDLCGGVDDHPRHVLANTIAGDHFPAPTEDIITKVREAAPNEDASRLLRDLFDTSSSDRHLDCCAAANCPLPADDPHNCANRIGGAEGKTGKALLSHLTKGQ